MNEPLPTRRGVNDARDADSLAPPSDAWPLQPRVGALKGIAATFGAGVLGGALTLTGLGVFAVPQHTCGASKSLALDRARQQRCLELGITPDELAEREQAGLEPGLTLSPEGSR